MLSVELTNYLQGETSIHWHGVQVPNPVDGVSNVSPTANTTASTSSTITSPKNR